MIAPDFRQCTEIQVESAAKNFISYNYGKQARCAESSAATLFVSSGKILTRVM